jgi:hypothetical protein
LRQMLADRVLATHPGQVSEDFPLSREAAT